MSRQSDNDRRPYSIDSGSNRQSVTYQSGPVFGHRPTFDSNGVYIGKAWADQLLGVHQSLSSDLRNADTFRLVCEVKRIYPDGEFHGTCRDGGEIFSVFAKAAPSDVPVGCSCVESRGTKPCVHGSEFLQFLREKLQDNRSSVNNWILLRRFITSAPNYDEFTLTPSQKAIAELDRAFAVHSFDEASNDFQDDTIAIPRTKITERLAWRIKYTDYGLSLETIIQAPKKKGGGYTKGRIQKLENVMRNRSMSTTRQDDRVLSKVSFADGYHRYQAEATLNVFDALEQLVGASNVYEDATEVDVRRDALEFSVLRVHDRFHIVTHLASDSDLVKADRQQKTIAKLTQDSELEDSRLSVPHFFGHPEVLLRFDRPRYRMSVIPCDEMDQAILKQLVLFQGVDASEGDALLERVRKLQSVFTIRFPDDTGGAILDAPAHLVVLLRSNADTSFDIALRIRDAVGRLRQVGAQPSITDGERNGKPVQFRRDIASEISRGETLARSLQMDPADAVDGESYCRHITDFGEALDLIDHLQSTSDQDDAPEILWDRNSEKPISVLGQISSQNVRVEINQKRDWFGISGHCEVNGKKIELAELLDQFAVEDVKDVDRVHGDFVRLRDGQWAKISEKLRKRLKRLRDATHADRKSLKLDATSAPAIRDVFADGEIELKAVKAWQQCVTQLANAEKLQPKVPQSLDADLRDYQIEGFAWLRRLAEWGVGGVLADDMGLGKTLQTLAVILDRKNTGPTLVIAPTSVGFNWVREAQRFTPDLNVHLYRETDRKEFLQTVGNGDLVICSYGLSLRDAAALSEVTWSTLVLDEAQAIKNSRSKTSIAIAGIPAKWKLALTGTPVENHLGELWSLFHVVSPGVLGGWESFRKKYALPIEKQDSQSARFALADRLKPFVLRRKKSEVLKELPPRTEMNLYVDLSAQERAAYEKMRMEALGEVDQLEATVTTQDQRFRILALLTRLRQISCHARLADQSYEGTSAKLQCLLETLTGLKEEGHRALIFSQFTQHLALIRQAIEQAGFTYEYLDGSTPAKSRQERVDAFQNGTSDVFLISLKAGGTGLNLTAADYVIHMDPWWNPAVEDQATDRAHRIGQQNPVMVYRIVARGTIEEEILALHESKRDLVAGVMDGTAAAGKLSNDELIAMLRKN